MRMYNSEQQLDLVANIQDDKICGKCLLLTFINLNTKTTNVMNIPSTGPKEMLVSSRAVCEQSQIVFNQHQCRYNKIKQYRD